MALGGEIGLQLRVIWAFHNRAGIGGEFGGVVVIHQHHPIAGSLNVACAVGGEGVALGVGIGAVLQRLGGFCCPLRHGCAAGVKMADELKMGVVAQHGVVAGDALQACDVFGLLGGGFAAGGESAQILIHGCHVHNACAQ